MIFINKYTVALPQKTIDHYSQFWIDMINRKESGSIIHISLREQLYRIPETLHKNSRLYKTLSTDVACIPLYISTLPVDDPVDIQAYLKTQIKTTKSHIALFVVGVDTWLKNNPDLIGVLDTFAHHSKPTVSCLYFFQTNITNEAYHVPLSRYGSVYQNIQIFPYFQKKDMSHFIHYLENKFQTKIPSAVGSEILYQCGSSMWLIKEAVRYYIKNGSKNVCTHEEMLFRLRALYNELISEEQHVLQKIQIKNWFFSAEEKKTLDYLLQTNLVKKKFHGYEITIPSLADFIRNKQFQQLTIGIDKNRDILVNGARVNDVFSEREKALVVFLLQRINKLITRDEIATVLWGEDNIGYSDWSVDMAINRLRNKLQKLGFQRNQLQTVKKQGFIFQN